MAVDGSLFFNTKVDTSGFLKGRKAITGACEGIKSAVGKIGRVVAMAFSFEQVARFAKECVTASNKTANAFKGLESIINGQGRSYSQATSWLQDYVSDGLIPLQNAVTAYKNLASRGYSDDQIKSTLTALKDSAAYGRQSAYTMGEAVQTATEGLKNENSILVDNAGVTKNVAKMWQDYAKSIGTSSAKLTQQQKIQAEVNGILTETRFQTGDAKKVANSFSGQVSRLAFNFNELKVAIGNILTVYLKPIVAYLNSALTKLTEFVKKSANLIGITNNNSKATESLSNNSSSASENYAEMAESAEDVAKANEKSLASFDKITKLASSSNSQTDNNIDNTLNNLGGGQITANVEVKTDEAENQLKDFFKRLKKKFARLFSPIKSAWNKYGEQYIQSAKKSLQSLWDMIKSIGKSFEKVWENGTGEKVIGDILQTVINLNDAVTNLATNFKNAWNTDGIGDKIAQNFGDAFTIISGRIKDMSISISNWSFNVNFAPLLKSFEKLQKAVNPIIDDIGKGLQWVLDNVLLPVGSWIIEEAVPASVDLLSTTLDILRKAVENFKPLGKWLWENFLKPIAKWTGKAVIKALDGLRTAISKLEKYVPVLDGIATGMAVIAISKLLKKAGVISKLAGAFVKFSTALAPISGILATAGGAFATAGGGFVGMASMITTAFTTGVTAFADFMRGLSPLAKVTGTIAGVIETFTTVMTTVHDLETGVINAGDAFLNISAGLGIAAVGITAMVGPKGLFGIAIAALVGLVAGATQAVDDNIEAVSKAEIYNDMGTPISEFSDKVTALADTIKNNTSDIISLGDAIGSNDEEIKNNSEQLQGLIDRMVATGDMSKEMAEKIAKTSGEISEVAKTNITESTNGIIKELGNHFEDTAKISGQSTQEIISNLYLLEADGNKLIAETNQEISDLSASMVDMDKSSEEFSNAQERLGELSSKLMEYSGYSDTTVESADNLIQKLQELDANQINWESETAVNEAMNAITSGYAQSMEDLDNASNSSVKVIDDLVKRYQNMGLLDTAGEQMFNNLKTSIVTDYDKQKETLQSTVDEKMNDFANCAGRSFENAWDKAEQQVYNNSLGGFFTYFGAEFASKWNGTEFENEMSKKIESSMDTSVNDGVNKAIEKIDTTNAMHGLAENNVKGYVDGWNSNASDMLEAMKKTCGISVDTVKEDVYDQHSPSKVFSEIAKNNVLGLKNGTTQNANLAISAMKTMCLQIVSNAKLGLIDLPNVFKSTFSSVQNRINEFVENSKSRMNSGVSQISSIAKDGLNGLMSEINRMENPFENYFNNILNRTDNFKNNFIGIMWDIGNSLGNVFWSIKENSWSFGWEINNSLKDALNQMIYNFNSMFQGLNSLNGSLAFVPGFNMGFNIPEIPYLATGTVVPANYGEFLAVLGDNKRETEVVSPLSTMKQALAEVLANSDNQNINLIVNLDGKQVLESTIKQAKNAKKRTGRNPFMI